MNPLARASAICVQLGLALAGCDRHAVTIEQPPRGRRLSTTEEANLQEVADTAFRDARAALEGLPPRLTLIVRFGKDVIPETGESGAAGFPGNVGLTLDPDRDVLATIRRFVRPCLLHELHHLARRSRVQTPQRSLEHVISEGLATAFERDLEKSTPPWGQHPPEITAWAREVLEHPEADSETWFREQPDGRRWVGYQVGTFLVDRASLASKMSAAELVFVPAEDVLRLAHFP
ncbi:MAG TPA: DUF2268 domain-containing putative Zn-dependent protease [Labilithrix sp.]|nr:DUF2268 domain-containing putative Zn-dependent protease [Labilithrix sp.]